MTQEESTAGIWINDRYRVVRELGSGGMGKVLLVVDRHRDDQQLALKTLLPQTTDHLLTAGFREEFAQLARLQHPNLADAYDFGRIANSEEYFFTTEFVDGVDVSSGSSDSSTEQLLQVTLQLLRALDFIHSHGLLHNDLKPANILLARSYEKPDERSGRGDLRKLEALTYGLSRQVKVIDFGLISREHTSWDKILGTPRYISPERILCAPADRRSDLYCLGTVLYLLFTGRTPFSHHHTRSLLKMHLETPPPRMETLRPDLPAEIPQLVHRLLEKRPEDRFASAGDTLRFLGDTPGWSSPAAPEVVVSGPSAWEPQRLSAGALLFRNREMAVLREHYDKASRGESTSPCLLVQGSAGIGKTRLVEEMRGHVQVTGGTFVALRENGVRGNLQPVVDAFVASLKTGGLAGSEWTRLQLSTADDGENASLLSRLEVAVLRHAAKIPTLLFLDDFDQASRAVRNFVRELVAALETESSAGTKQRILVVMSVCSGANVDDLRLGNLERLSLEAFSTDETRCFLHQVFRQRDIPGEVEDLLVGLSLGNPLFLLELANRLVDQRKARFVGTRWTFPESLEGVRLPGSLESLLREKLETLDPACREILGWFAVSAHGLTLGVLKGCARRNGDALEERVAELERKNFLVRRTLDDREEYQLTSGTIRDLVLVGLEETRQQQLHRSLAQSLEEKLAESTSKADILAEHWLLAGNDAGFQRYAPQAADLLRVRGDLPKATEYHRRIIDAMPETAVAKKVNSLARLSEMHELLWDLEACRSNLLEIQRLGGPFLKPRERAMLLRRLASLEVARHRAREADLLLDQAEPLARDDRVLQLGISALRAWTLWFTERQEESRRTLEQAEIDVAALVPGNLHQKRILISAGNQLAHQHQLLGNLAGSARLLVRNLGLLESEEEPQAVAATSCALGTVLLETGHFADAAARLGVAFEISKTIGDYRTLCRAREQLAECHLRRGRFKEALQATQAALQNAESIDNLSAVATSLRTLGRIYHETDQVDDALVVLRKALALHEQIGDIFNRTLSRLCLARLLIEEEELREATNLLRVVEEDVRRYRFPLLDARHRLLRFVVSWRAERIYARELSERARELVETHGYGGEEPELLSLKIEVELEARRFQEAHALLERLERIGGAEGQLDLCCETAYFRSLLEWLQSRRPETPDTTRIERMARSRNKLRLIARHDQLRRRLLDTETTPA